MWQYSMFNVPFFTDGILCEMCLKNGNRSILLYSSQNEFKFPCTVCQNRKLALAHCRNCKDSLCSTCLSVHQLIKAFENHEVNLFQNPNIIHSHTDKAIMYYCDNCQAPICVGCMLSNVGSTDDSTGIEDKFKTENSALSLYNRSYAFHLSNEPTQTTRLYYGQNNLEIDDTSLVYPSWFTDVNIYKAIVKWNFFSGGGVVDHTSIPPSLVHQTLAEKFSNNQRKCKGNPCCEFPAKIKYKIGQFGSVLGHFSCPRGFCLGLDEEIVVADTNNHRIQVFKKDSRYYFSYAFGNPGKEEGCLWYPSKVVFMKKFGNYLIYDGGIEFSRMQIFSKIGYFIKSIDIGFIGNVGGLTLTKDENIVAIDSSLSILNILSENGERLRHFNFRDYMKEPTDIAIHDNRYFVCDYKGHRVVVFDQDGRVIQQIGLETSLHFPNGIDISDAGDILVGDSCDKRFQVSIFSNDGLLKRKFRCPHHDKVNKCFGLRITSEGHVLTLGQNNHQVLVLDPLYTT